MALVRQFFTKFNTNTFVQDLFARKCQITYYRNSFHTTANVLAGHSKWQNIKSAKQASDQQKSVLFSKLSWEIRLAAENGSTDPQANANLTKAIEKAQSFQMPKTTIEKAIALASKSGSGGGEQESLVYSWGKDCYAVVDVVTKDKKKLLSTFNHIMKKAGFKYDKSLHADSICYTKGFISIKKSDDVTLDKAIDHGIELGAEEVTEEEGAILFETDDQSYFSVKKGLENLEYEILDCGLERFNLIQCEISAEVQSKIQEVLTKLEALPEFVSYHVNW